MCVSMWAHSLSSEASPADAKVEVKVKKARKPRATSKLRTDRSKQPPPKVIPYKLAPIPYKLVPVSYKLVPIPYKLAPIFYKYDYGLRSL